jgi:hypothetical protein
MGYINLVRSLHGSGLTKKCTYALHTMDCTAPSIPASNRKAGNGSLGFKSANMLERKKKRTILSIKILPSIEHTMRGPVVEIRTSCNGLIYREQRFSAHNDIFK